MCECMIAIIRKNDDYSIAWVWFRYWRISLQFHLLIAWHFDWRRNNERKGKTKIDYQNAFNFDKKRSLYSKSMANAVRKRCINEWRLMHVCNTTSPAKIVAISFTWNIIYFTLCPPRPSRDGLQLNRNYSQTVIFFWMSLSALRWQHFFWHFEYSLTAIELLVVFLLSVKVQIVNRTHHFCLL